MRHNNWYIPKTTTTTTNNPQSAALLWLSVSGLSCVKEYFYLAYTSAHWRFRLQLIGLVNADCKLRKS